MSAQVEAAQQQQAQKAEVPGLPTEGVSSKEPVAPRGSSTAMPQKDIVIKSATFGDETSATDVTKTLAKQLIDYGYVDVTADQSLIPIVNWSGPAKVSLTRQEEQEAQERAVDECGGAQNKSCVEVRKQQKMQLMLKEKQNKSVAADKVIKGRRLTVTYIDGSGRQQTMIVPDGNQFKVGNPDKKKGEINPFGPFAVLNALAKIGITLVVVFGWVYSVTATYRTFLQDGYRWIGYAATAAAIFVPYSGFFIMFVFFLIKSVLPDNIKKALAPYVPTTITSLAKRPGTTIGPLIKSTEPAPVLPGNRSNVRSVFSQ